MNHQEARQRLQSFSSKGLHILRLIENTPRAEASEAEFRMLTTRLKEELESEHARTLPERAQRSMSMFELSVYSPTIEEAWKDSGIRRLKINGAIDGKWQDVLDKASKYLP